MKILPLSSHKKFLLIRRFHRSRFYPNRRNAKKFLIGALIFIAVQIGLFIIIKPFKARAAWYDANYGYRQAITITNNGSLQSNYVVEVNVDTQTLIAAGKMQSNCNDIRFTSSDGSTLQNFFIDYCSNTASVNSSIFVKVGSIAASTTTTLYMYYGYGSATSGASAYSSIGAPTGIWLGTGKDGAISVTADTNINTADTISGRACSDTTGGDAVIYTSTANVAANDTTIALATNPSDPSCLTAGDEVLIFNAQGTSSATGDGKYEFARISSISTNVLTLNHALTNAYNGTNRKLVVQRVPNYTSVTLSNAGTDFTPSAWDGTKGGVMAFRSSGTVTVAASTTINANALGYTGGTAGTLTEVGGNAGESYDGPSTGRGGNGSTNGQTRGGGKSGDGGTASPADGGTATGAGGGGGSDGSANNTDGSAGAGGGGGYAGGGGGGAGGTDATTTTGRNGGTGGSAGTQAGGGGGGCADSNTNTVGAGGNAGSNGGTSTGCGSGNGAGGAAGTSGNQASGGGGSTSAGSGGGGGGGGYYGIANLTTLYFGSGGGGGGARDDGADGGNGGAGGGIVYVSASTISVSGNITSTGANGSVAATGGGNGGGGAGGSVLLRTITDTGTWTSIVTALGGNGGGASTDRPDGGDGGNGRMHFDYTDSSAPGSGSPTSDNSQVPYAGSPASELSYASYQASITTAWKFDEGYGTTAYDSANTTSANNGTLAGTTTPAWKTSEYCVYANCLYFEGTTAKVTLANDQNVKSVSMWIRPTSFASTMGLVDFGNSIRITVDTSGVMTATGFTSATKYINGIACSTCTLTLNRWQHIEVVDTTTVAGTFMVLGNYSTNYFKGFMDDVRMSANADSAIQVKDNYNARGSTKGTSASIGGDTKYLSDGLSGYWKMDETSWAGTCSGTPVVDSSGNGINGNACPNASAATVAAGKFGNAGSFDGTNDYVDLSTTLQTSETTTIAAWVYLNANTVSDFVRPVFAKALWGANGNGDIRIQLREPAFGQSGTARWAFEVNDSVGGTVLMDTISAPTSSWVFLVGVLNKGTMYLYRNGQLVGTSQISGTYSNNSQSSFIGAYPGNTANTSLNGKVDDLRIYNRALSSADVANLYNWAPGPIGYWKFDEGSGVTAVDSSGNGNNGTTAGSPTWSTGTYGKAINLNGSNQNVSMGNPALFQNLYTNAFTASAWVYLRSRPTVDDQRMIIIGRSQNANFTWHFAIWRSNSTTFYIEGSIENTAIARASLPTYALNLNTWTYLTMTYDNNGDRKVHLFINGVEPTYDFQPAYSGSVGTDTTFNLTVGSFSNNVQYWDGLIDDVKLYKYVRTPKQIVSDMNADHPAAGSPFGSPLVHWKMNERANNTCFGGTNDACNNGSGGTAYDGAETSTTITLGGKYNAARTFGGSSSISMGDQAFVSSASAMSISLWTQPTLMATAKEIVGKWTSGQTNFQVITDSSTSSEIRVYISSNGSTDTGSNYCTTSGLGLTAGIWQQLIVTYDGTASTGNQIVVYKNGLKITCNVTGIIQSKMTTVDTTSALKLGNYNTAGAALTGNYDDFKIYNYALNSAEVIVDYNQAKSLVLGNVSTDADGTATNSAARSYCPPGNTEGNCAIGQNPVPVVEYRLDQQTGSTLYDSSGNNQSLTWTKARYASGKYGSGAYFSGISQDRAYVVDNSLTDFTTTMTLEAWFKPAGDGAIIAKWSVPVQNGSYILYYEAGTLYYGLDSDGNVFNGSPTSCFPSAATGLQTNTWYHAALTYNAGTVNVYLNGVKVHTDTSSCPTSLFNSNGDFSIGNGQDNDPNLSFNGVIDQVVAFNYVRTPAQIAWDYNRGGPVAWYKFDECTGTTVYDASGNGFNGTQAGTTAGTCTTASSFRGGASGDSTTNSGKINYAGTFDGSTDRVTTSAFSPLANATLTTTKVSWGGWFYPTSFAARKTLMEKATEFRLDTDTSGNAICDIYTSGAFTSYAPTNTALTSSAWNHVLCVYNGSNVLTYINGMLRNTSSSQTGNITAASSVLHIGQNSSSAQRFTGRIDDVRIYNYDLTNQIIKVIYNGDSAVRFAPLTGTPQ